MQTERRLLFCNNLSFIWSWIDPTQIQSRLLLNDMATITSLSFSFWLFLFPSNKLNCRTTVTNFLIIFFSSLTFMILKIRDFLSEFESGNLGMGTDWSCSCKLEELIVVGSDFLVKSYSAAMSDGTSCFILCNLSKTMKWNSALSPWSLPAYYVTVLALRGLVQGI